MTDRDEETERQTSDWRWQYVIVSRYGPLGLVLLGLGMIVYAMAGDESDAVTITQLTLGFVSFVAGVVLPRIEGEFSARGQGVTGKLLSITQIESRRFVAKGPVLALDSRQSVADQDSGIMFGDAWDELEANGFRVVDSAAGHRSLERMIVAVH